MDSALALGSCSFIRPSSIVIFPLVVFGLLIASESHLCAADKKGDDFFERRIRPVLIRECYNCHSAAAIEIKGGLRVDSRDAIRAGGETDPAVVPHHQLVGPVCVLLRRVKNRPNSATISRAATIRSSGYGPDHAIAATLVV